MGKMIYRCWHWFMGKASIRRKLIISFAILVSIPIVILGVYSFHVSNRNLLEQTKKTVDNNLSLLIKYQKMGSTVLFNTWAISTLSKGFFSKVSLKERWDGGGGGFVRHKNGAGYGDYQPADRRDADGIFFKPFFHIIINAPASAFQQPCLHNTSGYRFFLLFRKNLSLRQSLSFHPLRCFPNPPLHGTLSAVIPISREFGFCRLIYTVKSGHFWNLPPPMRRKRGIGPYFRYRPVSDRQCAYPANLSGRLLCLINQVYKIEIEKKATELKALQAMIHPHFLYNTLSSIKWKALEKGVFQIKQPPAQCSGKDAYKDKDNRHAA